MPSAQYNAATIQRSITILNNAGLVVAAPIQCEPVKPAPKQTRKSRARTVVRDVTAWEREPATKGQHKRINALESALGLRKSPRRALGTGLDARHLYQSLKAEYKALNA